MTPNLGAAACVAPDRAAPASAAVPDQAAVRRQTVAADRATAHGGAAAPDRLAFAVVGTGRVGSALAAALVVAGHRLVAASGALLPYAAAYGAATTTRMAPGPRVAPGLRVEPGFVIVAVPDDALADVAAGLAGVVRPGTVVAHTSGAHGLAVLSPLAAAGAVPAALHPAMTFAGTPADLAGLRAGISFGVTAHPAARGMVELLVADLGGTAAWIAEEQRTMYHAALAHGANHLVTLVNEAADRLRDAGVRDPGAMLGPLLTVALGNALRFGDAALTGPVSRGDAGTVAAHVAELAARAPESVPPYLALARRTVDRAVTAGRVPAAAAGPLLDVLEPGDPKIVELERGAV